MYNPRTRKSSIHQYTVYFENDNNDNKTVYTKL